MKCKGSDVLAELAGSLPVWGEWIEILLHKAKELISLSLPVWGEWIEIRCFYHITTSFNVSSRMGRVD